MDNEVKRERSARVARRVGQVLLAPKGQMANRGCRARLGHPGQRGTLERPGLKGRRDPLVRKDLTGETARIRSL